MTGLNPQNSAPRGVTPAQAQAESARIERVRREQQERQRADVEEKIARQGAAQASRPFRSLDWHG
jgi:hypothetical protein